MVLYQIIIRDAGTVDGLFRNPQKLQNYAVVKIIDSSIDCLAIVNSANLGIRSSLRRDSAALLRIVRNSTDCVARECIS